MATIGRLRTCHRTLALVQDELATYLRSNAVAALASADSLDPYVTSLESTGRTPPWLTAAYREIGRLRREIRRIRAIESPTDSDRDALGQIASDVVSTAGEPATARPGQLRRCPARLAAGDSAPSPTNSRQHPAKRNAVRGREAHKGVISASR